MKTTIIAIISVVLAAAPGIYAGYQLTTENTSPPQQTAAAPKQQAPLQVLQPPQVPPPAGTLPAPGPLGIWPYWHVEKILAPPALPDSPWWYFVRRTGPGGGPVVSGQEIEYWVWLQGDQFYYR